jgi:hypothetical protein
MRTKGSRRPATDTPQPTRGDNLNLLLAWCPHCALLLLGQLFFSPVGLGLVGVWFDEPGGADPLLSA